MKLSCPSCGTSYRVADDKVPEGGARIKCPKCSVVFIGKRQAGDAQVSPAKNPGPPPPAAPPKATITLNLPASPPPVSGRAVPAEPADSGDGITLPPVLAEARHEQATPLQQLGTPSPAAGADKAAQPAPAQPSPGPEAEARPADQAARGISAIRAQSGAARTSLLESYRVRTSRGLTYDFPNRDTMIRWLTERDDIDGCEVAEPGGDWVPAASLLEINAPVASTAEMLAHSPGVPLQVQAPAPPRGTGQVAPAAPAPPRAGPGLWAATLLVLVAVLLVGAATATRYGVVDFGRLLPLNLIGVEFPRPRSKVTAATAASDESPEQRYLQAMRRARQAARRRAYSQAALEYNRALAWQPGSAEALRGLADACEKLGDLDRARAVRRKLAAVTGTP